MFQRLKLQYDETLSNFAFSFNLHRFNKGRTWAAAVATTIPNPDSKIHMLRLFSGHLALVLNSHAKLKINRKAGPGRHHPP